MFDKHSTKYQEEIYNAGYKYNLEYCPNPKAKKSKRKRKIIWYNPPFNLLTKTNLGKEFFKILDSSFPKGHPLHTTFNRNTVKLSYSCLPNMQSKISSHNKKILYNRQDNPPKGVENCSCPSSKKR